MIHRMQNNHSLLGCCEAGEYGIGHGRSRPVFTTVKNFWVDGKPVKIWSHG